MMYCPKCTMQFHVVEPEIIAKSRKKTCRCPECFLSFSHGQSGERLGQKIVVCVTPEEAGKD